LVTYLDELNKKHPWKFEDNYATPLIVALATACNPHGGCTDCVISSPEID
jgi:hypothetical protein